MEPGVKAHMSITDQGLDLTPNKVSFDPELGSKEPIKEKEANKPKINIYRGEIFFFK